MSELPAFFIERLKKIIPEQFLEGVLRSLTDPKDLCFRVNTLLSSPEKIVRFLNEREVSPEPIAWCPQGFKIDSSQPIAPPQLSIDVRKSNGTFTDVNTATVPRSCKECADSITNAVVCNVAYVAGGTSAPNLNEKIVAGTLDELVRDGSVYIQNPSSMLVSLILDPRPGERILDLCAAPGSKATHMAGLMNNEGSILCLEPIRKRFYKLRSVVKCLGATNIHCRSIDGRRYRVKEADELFDRILVDAPCSSEGRFHLSDPDSYAYWSPRKIKEMAHKQKGLLLNAARLLKVGGTLVYSTCTFSPEENEGVLNWLLRKTKKNEREKSDWHLEVLPIHQEGINVYPAVLEWEGKSFDAELRHCLRILPDEMMDAFFIAKLIKVDGSTHSLSSLAHHLSAANDPEQANKVSASKEGQ